MLSEIHSNKSDTLDDSSATFTHQQGNIKKENVSITSSEITRDRPEPKSLSDKFFFVFLTFLLLGVGTLIPWNMFITAKEYFVEFKLNVNDSTSESHRKHFLMYVEIAAELPNVIFNAVNIFIDFGGESFGMRIIGTTVIEIIVFLLTITLAMVDSSSWANEFFYITVVSVVIMNMANGIYLNSVYGLATKLPMKYSMAVVFGSNISGTFAAIVLIISIAASPSPRTAAIYYFIAALILLFACIDLYLALPLAKFYRYYDKLSTTTVADVTDKSEKPSFWQILCKVWPQCFNLFLIFFVTFSIFPAIFADINKVDDMFFISEKYFTPIICFLNFNIFAVLGSLLPSCFKWPGPKHLWIPVTARILMIPFFMFCNYNPQHRKLPVMIKNDWAVTLMGAVLGLSHGHFNSLAMMYAPGYVSEEHAPIAGMSAAFCYSLGVVCGILFTFFLSWFVEIEIE